MSPTPVSMSDPTRPTGYTWEATSEAVAERYGLPVDQIARFDLNTSPEPPRSPRGSSLPAASRPGCPSTRPPTTAA